MRGVPVDVIGPVDAVPLVVALPQPGRVAVEVPEAKPAPPGVLAGGVPWVCICGGRGLDCPGIGAEGLPVACAGVFGLVGPVVAPTPGPLVVADGEVAAPPVPPAAPEVL